MIRRNFKSYKCLLSYLLLFLILTKTLVYGAPTLPSPTNAKYINDYTDTIDEQTTNRIISIGYELEIKTGAQAIIAVINSTEGLPIEDYALKLFRGWGIGQKGQDNGLLILLAIKDQTWRVEVGRGLEGVVPDALTNRIMTDLARPSFIQENYSEGLLASYSTVCDTIAMEYGVTLDKSLNISYAPTSPGTSNRQNILGYWIVFILIAMDLILNRGRILSTIMQILFINSFYNRQGGPGNRNGRGPGGGGFGGFGGGSSSGGGSSGSW